MRIIGAFAVDFIFFLLFAALCAILIKTNPKETMSMTCTSAQAAKLLKALNEQLDALHENERKSREFLASVGEDAESVRPAYDYAGMQKEIAAVEARVRAVKHAINVFNTTTTVPGFDMTVDELLVYIPQLTKTKAKLYEMMNKLPKEREQNYGHSGIIDYRYANYDPAVVRVDYDVVSTGLSAAQTALDTLNNTAELTIPE